MKAFFLSNTSFNQLPFQPNNLIVVADSEEEALAIAKKAHGEGYEVMNSTDIEKGILDHY